MNCPHVLGLIDAGPLADYPQSHLEAAYAHARQCATCGPALEAAVSLSGALRSLPRPVPASEFTSRVMARIDALEQKDVVPAVQPETIVETMAATLSPWANAAGLAASIVAVLWSMASSSGEESLGAMGMTISVTPAAMPLLAAGLIVYVAGLFNAAEKG